MSNLGTLGIKPKEKESNGKKLLIGERAGDLLTKAVSSIPDNRVTRGIGSALDFSELNALTRQGAKAENWLVNKGAQFAKNRLKIDPRIASLAIGMLIPGAPTNDLKAVKRAANIGKGSKLVQELTPNRRMITPDRPLSKGLMSELKIRNDAISKAQDNFDKWDAYAKQVKSEGGKLRGSERMGLTGSKRKLQDITASPLQTTVARWFGAMGEKGYGVKGTKGVPGGKPAKGSGLDQHHLAPSREMYNMSLQTAMQVDLGFRVNTHQYLASKGVLPGWGKANMINIKAKPHRYELHPMLRSMGFERFWKDILKADPTLAAKDPNKFYDLIDQWHETVLTPSIQMANDAAMKGNTKQFVINKNELILPPTVRRQMENKTKSIIDQAKQDYIDALKIDSNRPSLFRNNLDAPARR